MINWIERINDIDISLKITILGLFFKEFHVFLIKIKNNIEIFLMVLSTSGVEQLIILLTFQCFQILLTSKMFPVWDFVVGIFVRKAMLNMGWVLSVLNY